MKSLTLVEPCPSICSAQRDGLNGQRSSDWAKRCSAAVAKGDDRAAAAAFMRYWLGRLRWCLSPERFKSAITATIPKVALEFGIIVEAPTTLEDYAEITAPTLLIEGGKTRAPTRAVVDLLGERAAECHVTVLKGAGHMSPFTHPDEVSRLILDHLATQR